MLAEVRGEAEALRVTEPQPLGLRLFLGLLEVVEVIDGELVTDAVTDSEGDTEGEGEARVVTVADLVVVVVLEGRGELVLVGKNGVPVRTLVELGEGEVEIESVGRPVLLSDGEVEEVPLAEGCREAVEGTLGVRFPVPVPSAVADTEALAEAEAATESEGRAVPVAQ